MKYLYLPVEVKKRSLIAKLVCAAEGVSEFDEIIVGDIGIISEYIDYLPSGVYLGKDMYEQRYNFYSRLKDKGFRIALLDEEGLIFQSSDQYIRRSTSPRVHGIVDEVFTWGDYQKKLLTDTYGGNTPITVTGNPRMQLFSDRFRNMYVDSISRIQKKYGKFILLNTNFGTTNNRLQKDQVRKLIIQHSQDLNELTIKELSAHEKSEQKTMAEFILLLNQLSVTFPDITFVLRPHPAENTRTWNEILAPLKNVFVDNDGNIVPWILASEMVIHNNCTTGIEAAIANIPVVAFEPISLKDVWEYNLSNELSVRLHSISEVTNLVGSVVNENENGRTDYQYQSRASSYLSNLHGVDSIQMILSRLKDLSVEVTTQRTIPAWKGLFYRIKQIIKYGIMRIGGFNDYHRQKFPPTFRSEVKSILSLYSDLIVVEEIMPSLFAIRKKK